MILLDTHVVYWVSSAPEKLSRNATRAIRKAAAGDGMAISSISLWELAMHVQRGWLRVKVPTRRFLEAVIQTPSVVVVEIGPEIAALAAEFPPDYPSDPADRLIGATARALDAPLVTKDGKIQDSPLIRTIW